MSVPSYETLKSPELQQSTWVGRKPSKPKSSRTPAGKPAKKEGKKS